MHACLIEGLRTVDPLSILRRRHLQPIVSAPKGKDSTADFGAPMGKCLPQTIFFRAFSLADLFYPFYQKQCDNTPLPPDFPEI